MNILWITNGIMPEVQEKLGVKSTSGHWVSSLANIISGNPDLKLSVATVTNKVDALEFIQGEKIGHFLLPAKRNQDKYHNEYEQYWVTIRNRVKPDIIHIHGSEYPVGLSYVRACGNNGVVLSLQGMVSVIEKYYFGGLSQFIIFKNITIRDLLSHTLFGERRGMKKRGGYEIELIRSINHVIGRTIWDKAHSKAINPEIEYHHCNEPMRPQFYYDRWTYEKCKAHGIYLSQGYYPLKGLHVLIEALPIIKCQYPDVVVRFGGMNPLKRCGFISKIRSSGYSRILDAMIRKNKLNDTVFPLGSLDADHVKDELLRCNVFVCPSSIENSSNSLGEAQLLGVPCVASYVGGTPDLIPNDNCGLMYRFSDPEVLAYQIMKVFSASHSFDNSYMIEEARKRHDIAKIVNTILEIYEKIAQK